MAVTLPKVEQLVDMIDYQEGSVVSRELIRQAGGTVTLFAFGEGEGLSEHTAPFDALVYVLEGKLKISIGGVEYRLFGGDTLVMPEDDPHALHAEERTKMLLVMIRS
jgi:quercetin dioxygenase-like cupin family protein